MIRPLALAALLLPTTMVGAAPYYSDAASTPGAPSFRAESATAAGRYYNDPAAAPGAPLTQSFVGRHDAAAHPAVCRVIVPEGNGMSLGSGTLVGTTGNLGLVVSNWHVVRDARGPIAVVFPNGFRSWARLLRTDRDWDLAALAIWRPDVQPVPIATYLPLRGEPLTIAGYGSGSYRMASGRCTDYYAPSGNMPQEIVELSVGARQGDSGGPIFNAKGELSGVLFGTSSGRTMGSYGGRVRAFLLTVLDDFQRLEPSPVQVAQQSAEASVQAAETRRATAVTPTAEHGVWSPAAPPVSAGGVAAWAAESTSSQWSPARPEAVSSGSIATRRGGGKPRAGQASEPSRLVAVTSAESDATREDTSSQGGRAFAAGGTSGTLASQPHSNEVARVAMAPYAVERSSSVAATSDDPSPERAELTPVPTAAVGAGAGAEAPLTLNWPELLGTTRPEQIKSVLAAIGALGIFWQGMRAFVVDRPRRSRRRTPARRKRYARR